MICLEKLIIYQVHQNIKQNSLKLILFLYRYYLGIGNNVSFNFIIPTTSNSCIKMLFHNELYNMCSYTINSNVIIFIEFFNT